MLYMKLFKPGQIGKLTLKNRVIMAPMNVGGLNQSDGKLSMRGIEYFVERARGGTGMIIVGITRTTTEFEQDKSTNYARNTLADDKIHVSWMNELSEACHDHGAKVAIQLSPGVGRQAGAFLQSNSLAIGTSEISCFWPPHKKTRQLTKDEIHRLVDSFQAAAYHIRSSGIDAIHIHGHEGYLLDQFSTTLWNHRTDEYGGSLENRMRFAKELIDAIHKGAGDGFPIIYRFGLSHYLEGGREISEGLEIARLLEEYGVDALDIDSGCYETWYLPHPPSTIEPGFKLDLAAKVSAMVDIPVIASGKIAYPEIAESALESGAADFICLGRPLIADPEWVSKAEQGCNIDIRPCICCHEGCLKRIYIHKSISCAVNPAAGNERELKIHFSKIPQRILVIGAGVAGMEASRTLSLRGHKVRLIDMNSSVGGNFRLEFLPPFKSDYRRYIMYLDKQIRSLGVELDLNQEFSMEYLAAYDPDMVVIACGARHKKPDIPGLDLVKQISILEAFSAKGVSGRVSVLGGGLVGTEAAINLAHNGAEVSLIEMKNEVAADAFLPNKMHLRVMLDESQVCVYTNTRVISLTEDSVLCQNDIGDSIVVTTDQVVICMGMISNQSIENQIKNSKYKYMMIGDCVKPGKVIDAVWDAYRKLRYV